MRKLTFLDNTNKRNSIKVLVFLLIIVIGYGIHPVFAGSDITDWKFLWDLSNILDKILKMASWIWIPLASLAGKFMSNDMVYASWLHMDSYLWQMWNVSKNFANFGILGLLIRETIQYVINKKNSLQKIIGKAIIAGIAIQMSRFLMATVIDISTIATTAVGSFPASLLASDTVLGQKMDTVIEETMKKGIVQLDKEASPKWEKISYAEDESTSDTKNKMMPKYNSVSGPLMFIWASTLNIQDMMSINKDAKKDAKSIIINFWLKWIILLFYVIILTLLLIANIMRVWFLRIFIAISPLIILTASFSGKGLWKIFTRQNLIAIIFKPTIFVAILWLILVFIVSMQSIMLNNGTTQINGTTITQDENGVNMEINGIASITTNEKILNSVGSTAQNIIPNLIIYFATLFLLRLLVKISLGSGTDPIAWVMQTFVWKGNNEWAIQNMAKNIPLPGTWGLGYNALKKRWEGMKQTVGNKIAEEYFGKWTTLNLSWGMASWKFENREMDAVIRKWTWWRDERSVSEFDNLQKTINKWEDFLAATRSILEEETHEGLSGEMKYWTNREDNFKTWISKPKAKTGLTKDYKDVNEITKEDWKKIHERLGGKESDIPKNYEEFKKIKYGNEE